VVHRHTIGSVDQSTPNHNRDTSHNWMGDKPNKTRGINHRYSFNLLPYRPILIVCHGVKGGTGTR
jgi:hypothetical protein